jgi:hypothetical protein
MLAPKGLPQSCRSSTNCAAGWSAPADALLTLHQRSDAWWPSRSRSGKSCNGRRPFSQDSGSMSARASSQRFCWNRASRAFGLHSIQPEPQHEVLVRVVVGAPIKPAQIGAGFEPATFGLSAKRNSAPSGPHRSSLPLIRRICGPTHRFNALSLVPIGAPTGLDPTGHGRPRPGMCSSTPRERRQPVGAASLRALAFMFRPKWPINRAEDRQSWTSFAKAWQESMLDSRA